MSRRRCCGFGPNTPSTSECGTTSTVPTPWPNRIYTIEVSGSFGTTLQRVSMNNQGQDCNAEPEPNCQEEALALYYLERCCGQGEVGSALRKVVMQGSTSFSGSFEFDSSGRTSDGPSCTTHIPVSYTNTTQWPAICPAEQPGPTVLVRKIYECSKPIISCENGTLVYGTTCLDNSQILAEFYAVQGANYERREDDCTTSQQCYSVFLTGYAMYRRAKSISDTHVAVGTYTMVWSSTPYGDDCYYSGPKLGCPGESPFPSTITVGIKP